MKKSSFRAQTLKRTFYSRKSTIRQGWHTFSEGGTNLIGVVQVEQPALRLVDVLMARINATNNKSSVHMHVMAGKVECDEALEDNSPSWEGRGKEN